MVSNECRNYNNNVPKQNGNWQFYFCDLYLLFKLVYEKKRFWSCLKTPQKRAKRVLVMSGKPQKTGKTHFGHV
jgi:hypothetical protein